MHMRCLMLALISIVFLRTTSMTGTSLTSRPHAGQIWQHYSGKTYKILAVGRLTESDTLEECVVYEALYTDPQFGDHQVWIRPLNMFLEEGEFKGIHQQRFILVSQPSTAL